jgi:hypothetical protein
MKLQIGHIIGLFIAIIIIGCILIPWSKKNTETFVDPPSTSTDTTSTDTTSETPEPTEDLSKYNLGDNFDFDTSGNAKLLTLFEYILNTRNLSKEYEDKIKNFQSALHDKTKLNLVKLDDYKNIIKTLKDALKEELPNKKIVGPYLINRKIQEDKIIDLKSKIKILEDKINNELSSKTTSTSSSDPQSIKSIKSVLSGINLSTVDLGSLDDKLKSIGKFDDNLKSNSRLIMIALNNGFLTYDKNVEVDDSDKNSVGYYPKNKKYYIRHGDKANNKQHFIVKENKDGNMIIQPIHVTDYYICVGLDGLSIEKYFGTNTDGKVEDPKYQWIVSNNVINGCNKLEKNIVTAK